MNDELIFEVRHAQKTAMITVSACLLFRLGRNDNQGQKT